MLHLTLRLGFYSWLLAQSFASHPYYLTATALVADSSGNAMLQCWQFTKPFTAYPTTGVALHLADVSNVSIVVLPAGATEGLHKPPHPM